MENIFYLAQVFDGIHAFLLALMVLSVLSVIVSLVTHGCALADRENENIPRTRTMLICSIVSLVIASLGMIFTPTQDTFLLMYGGKIVDHAVENNPEVKDIPGNTLNLLNEYIKTKTEELKPQNNEN